MCSGSTTHKRNNQSHRKFQTENNLNTLPSLYFVMFLQEGNWHSGAFFCWHPLFIWLSGNPCLRMSWHPMAMAPNEQHNGIRYKGCQLGMKTPQRKEESCRWNEHHKRRPFEPFNESENNILAFICKMGSNIRYIQLRPRQSNWKNPCNSTKKNGSRDGATFVRFQSGGTTAKVTLLMHLFGKGNLFFLFFFLFLSQDRALSSFGWNTLPGW